MELAKPIHRFEFSINPWLGAKIIWFSLILLDKYFSLFWLAVSQSLSKVIIHLVFSTKNRESLIVYEIKERLHGYLAMLVRHHDWECYRVGGVADHVHLALLQPRTADLAGLVGHIKRQSTQWLKREGVTDFRWQGGYGAFSVSPCRLSELLAYIDGQEEHHKKLSFQEEYVKFLKKYHIEYDEKYIWD